MKSVCTFRIGALAVLAAALPSCGGGAGGPQYDIQDLGISANTGGQTVTARINNASQVLLSYLDLMALTPQVKLWYNGQLTDLALAPGSALFFPGGTSLDDRANVVGYAFSSDSSAHALLWRGGTGTELPPLPGYSNARAQGVRGNVVVGFSALPESGQPTPTPGHATLWNGGAPVDLGTLGGTASEAAAVNGTGQIAGWSTVAGSNATHAFRVSAGKMTDLGTLGGTSSSATDINGSGEVVGWATVAGVPGTPDGPVHAAIWSENAAKDLGVPSGYDDSRAAAVNNLGDVVGTVGLLTNTDDEQTRAFLYTGGRVRFLDDLIPRNSGWTLMAATGINDRGQIVGWGTRFAIPGAHAFLLTPRSH